MSYPNSDKFPRRIVVDDTDPRVEYAGSWLSDDTSLLDNLSCNGPTYNHTMHGTNQNNTSFSFTFEGDFVSVWGAKDTRKTGQGDADKVVTLPRWQCQIDGSSIPSIDYLTEIDRLTNNILCETRGLSTSSPHTLTLTALIDDPDTQTFWLDKVEYAPAPNVNVTGKVIKVDSSDQNIRYDNTRNWFPNLGNGILFNYTKTIGASVFFTFNGTSVSLYGFNEGDSGQKLVTNALYSIDNVHDTPFAIRGNRSLPSNSSIGVDYYNEFLFQSPDLEPGTHNLTITFAGPTSERYHGLTVDYFYVTASEGSIDLTNSVENQGGSFKPEPGPNGAPVKAPIGAIVGSAVGGITLLGLLFFVFIKFRKRKKGSKADTDIPIFTRKSSGISPYPYVMPSIFDPRSSDMLPHLPVFTLFTTKGRSGDIPAFQNYMVEPPPDYTVEA
ncbi:hypothetical protein VNI00_016615 [Paramarasmius palmivorus]|uniref:Transmembrane protein n=1 Tax=Paramarasmius palmivorus TaxID=297713 RepID=A0AAW0BCS2_9AGAR